MNITKIGFVLLSNSQNPIPSTRIAALNMLPFLREAGFDPHIVFEPKEGQETPDVGNIASHLKAEGFQIIVFQKVHGENVEKLVRDLSALGVKTVYSVCDLVNAAMVEAADATVVVTDYLKSLYPKALQSKISVVHDGIEYPNECKTDYGRHRGSRSEPLRAVLVTSVDLWYLPVLEEVPDWLQVTIVGRYAKANDWKQKLREIYWKYSSLNDIKQKINYLQFLVNPRIRCVAWDPIAVYSEMKQADVGIIPIETLPKYMGGSLPPMWKVKSENRLTMKMCLGLPVVATPIPSYEPVINQEVNGFLVNSQKQWIESLEAFRDPELRRDVGVNARESVLERYSMQEQAKRFVDVLKPLV